MYEKPNIQKLDAAVDLACCSSNCAECGPPPQQPTFCSGDANVSYSYSNGLGVSSCGLGDDAVSGVAANNGMIANFCIGWC